MLASISKILRITETESPRFGCGCVYSWMCDSDIQTWLFNIYGSLIHRKTLIKSLHFAVEVNFWGILLIYSCNFTGNHSKSRIHRDIEPTSSDNYNKIMYKTFIVMAWKNLIWFVISFVEKWLAMNSTIHQMRYKDLVESFLKGRLGAP